MVNMPQKCEEYEFNSVEDALKDFAENKFVIVMDSEDRENEGDLIIAGKAITTEQMAFLIRYSSGYICVPMTGERLDELQLPLMVPKNTELMKTAYTVSVDYVHNTSTGISAHDRATTARKLADPTSKPEDFSRPGHILPLRAVDNGVLERFGHTEAGVDLCKLAGLPPVACIGELLKEDDLTGGMARRDDCFAFGKKHGIKMVTIKDLIAHRKRVGL
ncbi:3,4-dihydroxy-2-butanone 4-phosphate synthase [Zychaea mexicana]|uniref:3,4-dihydroxy-2-butanone 4-phosphate synthase n=1 Tax=Zychaea mexicana TaxID=64656 RepID=UPI0022FE72DD|nr:3,4-dihydroxy-2-butanone 4-phosphate synthase [Zychaea mexicana]KAI9499134.1 3,4-dihydroxy-2-butanone 4-phosphate synthase [Zychaea mexicana]